jgi:hypothetical protein
LYALFYQLKDPIDPPAMLLRDATLGSASAQLPVTTLLSELVSSLVTLLLFVLAVVFA